MEDDLLKVRDLAMIAQNTAEKGIMALSSHENVCAERYDGIKDRLKGIPRLFEILENQNKDMSKQSKLIYIGMGFCIAIPTLIEVFHIFIERK